MTIVSRTEVLFLGAVALFFGTGVERLPGQQDREKPIVVTVLKTHGRISYKIESKPVEDPLSPLGDLLRERGGDCPVVAILPWDATFREEYDVEVIASKAGFKNVRSFVYDPQRGFMAEIRWGPSLPFTTNPPPD
ncbi:MAG TPA: hypothetical protein VF860_04670 [Candidatus Acidoferrales bacterium]